MGDFGHSKCNYCFLCEQTFSLMIYNKTVLISTIVMLNFLLEITSKVEKVGQKRTFTQLSFSDDTLHCCIGFVFVIVLIFWCVWGVMVGGPFQVKQVKHSKYYVWTVAILFNTIFVRSSWIIHIEVAYWLFLLSDQSCFSKHDI